MTEKLKETKTITPTEKRSAKVQKVNSTIIAKCDCKSEFQDQKYGKGMRAKNSYNGGFRCTVCGK